MVGIQIGVIVLSGLLVAEATAHSSSAKVPESPPKVDQETRKLVKEAARSYFVILSKFQAKRRVSKRELWDSVGDAIALQNHGRVESLRRIVVSKNAAPMERLVAARALLSQKRFLRSAGDAIVSLFVESENKKVLARGLSGEIVGLMLGTTTATRVDQHPLTMSSSRKKVQSWWKKHRATVEDK